MASEDITGREPDPFAESLRSDTPVEDMPGPTLVGFYARSVDNAEYGRLYLAKGIYIEFALEDVAAHSTVAEGKSPACGKRATAIRFLRDAELVYRQEEITEQFTIDTRMHTFIAAAGHVGVSSHFSCC
jgi:hypothetical protein